MKTLLIVLAILVLLGMVVFILIHEHKKVEEVSQLDSDAPEAPEKPEEEAEVEVAVPETTDTTEDTKPGSDSFIDEGFNELDATDNNPEVDIPEHCKPKEEPVDNLPNKYFFNIHTYTTIRHRSIFCVVCNAVIKGNNYKVIVANSYYPYIGSYTKTLRSYIVSRYTSNMTVEEFLKTGSTKFDRVGEIVESFIY